jgi:hypothetical protein
MIDWILRLWLIPICSLSSGQSGDIGVEVQYKKYNEFEILADPAPLRGLPS